jgi:hypothetical protein
VNVGTTKLRDEIRAKRLRARKIGRRTVITADDLENWAARLPDTHDVAAIPVAKHTAGTTPLAVDDGADIAPARADDDGDKDCPDRDICRQILPVAPAEVTAK